MMNLKFREARKYISVINKVSICMVEDGSPTNYGAIGKVPEDFDDMYVYGFGMIDSEFTKDQLNPIEEKELGDNRFMFCKCIEFALANKPREEEFHESKKQEKLLRAEFIQTQKGIHYFIVIEHNEWNHDDDQWIGIYDDLSELKMAYDRTCEYLKEEISYANSLSDDRSVQIYRVDEDNSFVKTDAIELFRK